MFADPSVMSMGTIAMTRSIMIVPRPMAGRWRLRRTLGKRPGLMRPTYAGVPVGGVSSKIETMDHTNKHSKPVKPSMPRQNP